MTIGAWRDRARPPETAAMAAGLSVGGRECWAALAGWLHDAYGLDGQPAWEGTDAGWVLRVRRSGRPLVTLSPADGDGFVALVVVGPTAWPAVEALDLTEPTREACRAAVPHPDGRWLWLRVDDAATVRDVQRLVTLKSPPPRWIRSRAVQGPRAVNPDR